MSDGLVEAVRQALLAGFVVAAPVLLVGFVVGTLAGLLQAATGVHEPHDLLVHAVTLPWMVERLAELFRASAAGP